MPQKLMGNLEPITDADRARMLRVWQNPAFPPEFRRELEKIHERLALSLTGAWLATQLRYQRRNPGDPPHVAEARERKRWEAAERAKAERERAAAQAKAEQPQNGRRGGAF